jgi:hypothetical protein
MKLLSSPSIARSKTFTTTTMGSEIINLPLYTEPWLPLPIKLDSEKFSVA